MVDKIHFVHKDQISKCYLPAGDHQHQTILYLHTVMGKMLTLWLR